ncbi:winged helix-turn-helix domain-containing protein [Enterococcus sp. BWR-S5]|uniref:winged helix-turn-helix domain-containing protein n=1 Tax=Enterococcus sp. BWR-S5 TaxID=2787714 RepID=UPI001922C1E2|nr:winged helix-turn-helix domain-containing protein [Enterococcus sp. BWR-S5]
MPTIGVFNLSGTLKQQQKELLSKENIRIVELEKSEIDKALSLDAAVIVDEHQKNVSDSCVLITKLREKRHMLLWTYGNEISEVNRMIYLQLGVDGNIISDQGQEFFLIVRNALTGRQALLGKDFEHTLAKNQRSDRLELNPDNQSVIVNGEDEIGLTGLEYRALSVLSKQPKKTFKYDELYEKLWGTKRVNGKPRIANIIFHLRSKLENDPVNLSVIKTVRSKGYMFVPPTDKVD